MNVSITNTGMSFSRWFGDLICSHVTMHKELYNFLPPLYKRSTLGEYAYRDIGIRQSPGWEHYMIHKPEPVSSPLAFVVD